MSSKINIAIDGHSSCGKSTLAKDLAKKLNYVYIDSGSMYRAVALYFLNQKVDLSNNNQVEIALANIHIDLRYPDQTFQILLNNQDVTKRIIALDVSNIVSEVATLSSVRRKLVLIQKELGKDKGVVMDGRDIGTVVFPDAELKLFVTANLSVRTQRRYDELNSKELSYSYKEIKANLLHRDHIDSTREDSPLVQSKDAILIDNSYMDQEEQLFLGLKLALEKVESK